MNSLTIKQKIILGIIVFAMLGVIGIYGITTLNKKGEEIEIEKLGLNNQVSENEELSVYQNLLQNEDVEILKNYENVENINQNNNTLGLIGENSLENLEGKIIVHITGEVNRKGILILKEGARIADAIDAAEGITDEADLDEVNLAYELEDGQKIYIPNKKDKENEEIEANKYIDSSSGNNIIIESKNEKGENKKVNINTATQSELESLPGIGPSIASKIIEYRNENGKFNKIEDLQNVKGIGDAKFNNIKEYIEVK